MLSQKRFRRIVGNVLCVYQLNHGPHACLKGRMLNGFRNGQACVRHGGILAYHSHANRLGRLARLLCQRAPALQIGRGVRQMQLGQHRPG